jgi:predicted AlkP superfamily pyrophosphatase or phosphodiesterase
MERSRFVIEVAEHYILPEYSPDVLTVWLSQPDHTQHECGLGSPEALAVLKEIDQLSQHFVEGLERHFGRENLSCLFLSDHGFYTVFPRVDPDQRLYEGGFKKSRESNDIVYSASNIYLNSKDSKRRLADILRFLRDEPWVGGLFLREDLLKGQADVMPQSAVFSGSHERSADVTLTFSWTEEENEFNVSGCAASSSAKRAGHGSASPFAVNNTFLAWGAGIKRGLVSSVPCGVVDVAPTVLHMLGYVPPVEMDGRVLLELLEEETEVGQQETEVGQQETEVDQQETEVGRQETEVDRQETEVGQQVVQYSVVDGHRYVDLVRIDRLTGDD